VVDRGFEGHRHHGAAARDGHQPAAHLVRAHRLEQLAVQACVCRAQRGARPQQRKGALRDQAKADSERAQAVLDSSTHQAITPQIVESFAATARKQMRRDGGGYRRDHLRAFARRVEVAEREVLITGSKGELLRTLAAIGGGNRRK
jgi:hypothetical protein